MPVVSVLFDPSVSPGPLHDQPPPFFADLNLEQVIDSITDAYEDYQLKPFFYTPLNSPGAVAYRHQVLRDLQQPALVEHLTSFAQKMGAMREHLSRAREMRYQHQAQRWFVEAVDSYCEAVHKLNEDMASCELASQALLSFRSYLGQYCSSEGYTALFNSTHALLASLSGIRYALQIRGNRITVVDYTSEADYSAEVLDTFDKFKQSGVKDYRVKFRSWPEMNHIEAAVLDRVARLNPEVFSALATYCEANRDYQDSGVTVFEREIQFYLAYLAYIDPLKRAGLEFSHPEVRSDTKAVHASDTFDLALAHKLVHEKRPVVCNDFYLEGPERVFVVSGPNQGGKTTFSRTFGQLHYLASIGCPVPGRQTRLFLFDQIYTHFEKEETITNLTGKLEDDLVRIHEIIEHATSNSIIIMNEIFTSTTLQDAIFLSTEVLRSITEMGCLCVCVTFIDELASLDDSIVSMMSTVVPEDPAQRTYKVRRSPANGLAYAVAIAEKYGLTYQRLKERLAS